MTTEAFKQHLGRVFGPPPNGPEPSWITGSFDDDLWVASYVAPGLNVIRISFLQIDPRFRFAAKAFIWACEYVEHSSKSRCVGVPQGFYQVFCELRFVVSQALSRGLKSFADITQRDLDDIVLARAHARKIRSRGHGGDEASAVDRTFILFFYAIFDRLYAYGPYKMGVIPDGLAFVPRNHHSKIKTFEVGQTALIPEHIARKTLSRAVEFVQHYSRTVSRLLCLHKEYSDYVGGHHNCAKRWQIECRISFVEKRLIGDTDTISKAVNLLEIISSEQPSNPSPQQAVARLLSRSNAKAMWDFLLAACFIIFNYFTGFRMHEIMSLRKGDIRLAGGRAFIKTLLTKTSRHRGGLEVERLGPLIVGEAFNSLESLHVIAFAQTKSGRLWVDIDGDSFRQVRLNGAIDLFVANFVNVEWTLRSHQMRRFFAFFYMSRYAGPIDAIRWHFRHVSEEMVFRYASSKAAAKYLVEARRELASRIVFSLLTDDSTYSSVALRRRLSNAVTQYRAMNIAPEQMEQAITSLVSDYVSVEPSEWGFCLVQTRSHAGANCASASGVPEARLVSPVTCVSCPHFVVSKYNAGYWKGARSMHVEIAQHQLSPLPVKLASQKFIRQIDRLLAGIGGPLD